MRRPTIAIAVRGEKREASRRHRAEMAVDEAAGWQANEGGEEAGYRAGQVVRSGSESGVAEYEDGEQGRGRHDWAVHEDRVEEQRAQRRVGQDVAPPFEQVAWPEARRVG